MKKILISLFGILLLTGCTSSGLKEISYDDLVKKIKDNKETFVLYVGSKTCSHCQEFRPRLEKAINKYKLDVYYIDMADLSNAKYNAVMNKIRGEGTPTTVYIVDGKVEDEPRIPGARDYDTIVDFFKEIGYIENEG